LLTGLKPGEKGPLPRDYHPPGGESFNDVARRARISLIALLLKYGKELEEPPKEFLDKMVIDVDSPNILPEGIPHVVVVSHKVFMIELYESMFRWNGLNTRRLVSTIMLNGKHSSLLCPSSLIMGPT
jgi:hypothetical protein